MLFYREKDICTRGGAEAWPAHLLGGGTQATFCAHTPNSAAGAFGASAPPMERAAARCGRPAEACIPPRSASIICRKARRLPGKIPAAERPGDVIRTPAAGKTSHQTAW